LLAFGGGVALVQALTLFFIALNLLRTFFIIGLGLAVGFLISRRLIAIVTCLAK